MHERATKLIIVNVTMRFAKFEIARCHHACDAPKCLQEADVMKFHNVFDFVMAGSGGGSMCAALVMRAHGKRVVVLEKTDLIGGTAARGACRFRVILR